MTILSSSFYYHLNERFDSKNNHPGRGIRNAYTLVYDRVHEYTHCIRPYYHVIHGSVLRSYFSVSYMKVYGCLRRSTERNEDRIRTLYSRTVNDRIFLRMLSYIFVNDTEIYDRNTEPGISAYFSVYGRMRPWLFDLGTY